MHDQDPHEGMTIHDVVSADEIHEYDKDAEYAQDAADEAADEAAAREREEDEHDGDVCVPELIDGTYEGCGGCEDCLRDEFEDVERDYELGVITLEEALDIHARSGAL